MNRISALKAPLVAHASQPNIWSTLPRFTSKESHFFLIEEICFFVNNKIFFRMKSASCQFLIVVLPFSTFRSVLAVLGITLDTQTSSQAQTSQAQTSQAQTSQGQTGDISNSEKEAMMEKSKEESSVAS